nr:hypothetical protein [Rhodococcus sp. (in: high G+C Gram-positive bacteria)]
MKNNVIRSSIVIAALLSVPTFAAVGTAAAAPGAYCSPSIGCSGKDDDGNNVYPDGPEDPDPAATRACALSVATALPPTLGARALLGLGVTPFGCPSAD